MIDLIVLDIFSLIITTITAFFLIGLGIAVAIAFVIYLAFRSLPLQARQAIILVMFVVGFILIISVLGIEIGFIVTMVGVFLSILNAFGGGGGKNLIPQG